MFQAIRGINSNNQPLSCVFNDGNHKLFHWPTFKGKTADERLQPVYQINLCRKIWDRVIEPSTVLQTLIAGSKDADNETTLCYTVSIVDTEEHWPQLFKQSLNWTTQEEMVTHLQSSTTKIQPQQRTQQRQLKQRMFSLSCQLFYITRRTKFGHTPSSTQEAVWQYFSRRQPMNYVFRKKHVNNLSGREPTEQTQKLVTQRQQKFQIWKTTNATISNR